MFPLVAIFAGVAIAATTASWILDGMTEKEKERQNKLNSELSELKNKFDLEINNHNQNIYELARDNYKKIKEKFLAEVEFYKKEKKDIKKDLEKLSNTIEKELKNESISPYQRQSLIDNRNQVEDAKNRIDAYWKYLDWFEKKLNDLAKYKKYQEVFNLEMPQPLLPEEYLYLGKLAYITKTEIAINGDKSVGWNKYNQKLSLNDYFNKKEIDIINEYSDSQEFMILIDHTKDYKHFNASAIKGQLSQYILEDLSFEVRPKVNERPNQEKLTLLYNDIWLTLKRNDKQFPLKRYKEYDSFEVKVKEYDLLLKNIFVTEKFNELNQDLLNNRIYIIFEKDNSLNIEQIQNLENELQKNNNFQAISLINNSLTLKVGKYLLNMNIDKNNQLLILQNIEEAEITQNTSNSFILPFEIILVEKEIYFNEYKNLLLSKETAFNDFLLFINEQFNYINYSNKTSNKDFEFFKKWQRIIDYQIEDNSFDIYEIEYQNYSIEENILNFNVLGLDKLHTKIKDKRAREIFIEINNINIGFLDDYSIEENILKSKIDFIDKLDTFSKNGKLFIKIKSYQAVLQKQKKALKDFAFSKIVNQDLKQMLISPNLINYKPILNEIELNFKNRNLTTNQKEIIIKALNEKNIFLIQGPPGTGKTTIIKEMIYQTIKQNPYSKILIVSQQNVAVDNVLDGIDRENREWFEKDGHSIVRVAPNEDKIQYDNIKEFTIEKWFEKYKNEVRNNFIKLEQEKNDNNSLWNFFSSSKEKKELSQKLFDFANEWMNLIYKSDFREIDNEIKELLISKHQILGATCVGLANKSLGLDLLEFDIAIIDEAGRATAPELLIPILRAKKIILIGDHNQLPPTIDRKLLQKIEDDNEDELSIEDLEILKKSFFEELFEKTTDNNKAMLNEQFRMPEKIGNLISKLFYDNKLKNGHIKSTENFIDPQTIIRWIDVKGTHEIDGTSSYNELEIERIINLLETINKYLENKSLNKTIGIITPYSAQKRKIRKEIKTLALSNISNLKVDTVDSFQGEEADIIIYSTVKSYGNISFLIDKKRLNVAISRTKENLFFIGNRDFFYKANTKQDKVNLFRIIIEYIKTSNKT